MDDEVVVLEDETEVYPDETVARVRVLSVPESERFAEGLKYAFHYGKAGADHPVIRFDNHHGLDELHLGERTFEVEYHGLDELFRAWRAGLPTEKRDDW